LQKYLWSGLGKRLILFPERALDVLSADRIAAQKTVQNTANAIIFAMIAVIGSSAVIASDRKFPLDQSGSLDT
jgi:hypothetical protein